jgi:hypothetical protein
MREDSKCWNLKNQKIGLNVGQELFSSKFKNQKKFQEETNPDWNRNQIIPMNMEMMLTRMMTRDWYGRW